MKRILTIFFILTGLLRAQQIGDPDFKPPIVNPAYKINSGSVVLIDEAHNNFHTMSGRYKPFADLITLDGYVAKPNTAEITPDVLRGAKILLISNPLHKRNIEDWSLPTPSAFTEEELITIEKWVKEGGSLFLISDHMPFPGASEKLAALFGFRFNNGFATDTAKAGGFDLFTRRDATLGNNFITNGRNENEAVDSIYSFTGQAFQIPKKATPVLVMKSSFISLMPDTAWSFSAKTPKVHTAGWSQGAVLNYFKGRVVIWGEAAMFSAQISGTGQDARKVGMNSPEAKNNYKLLLNLIHWLDGKLKKP